jgi:hypothetical protein
MRGIRVGSAADVATTTQILGCRFGGYYKYGDLHRRSESNPHFALPTMVAGHPGNEILVREVQLCSYARD